MTQDLEFKKQLLKDNNITAVAELDGFICILCGIEISTRTDLFSQHMRARHHVRAWRPLLDAVRDVSKTFPKEHPNREAYRKPYAGFKILSKIPGLPVLKAYRPTDSLQHSFGK